MIIKLVNQHLDMPHLSGGWMISVLTDVDLKIFVNKIRDKFA